MLAGFKPSAAGNLGVEGSSLRETLGGQGGRQQVSGGFVRVAIVVSGAVENSVPYLRVQHWVLAFLLQVGLDLSADHTDDLHNLDDHDEVNISNVSHMEDNDHKCYSHHHVHHLMNIYL